MRILKTDEWVIHGNSATGPYARLQAMDDPNCEVIWPRDWYLVRGEQFNLFDESRA